MKKLFFALALAGFVGAATVNTVSAASHKIVFVKGGEEKDKKKDCKKDGKCCSKDAASADKKDCSKDKKCCHSKGSTSSTETKTEDKK